MRGRFPPKVVVLAALVGVGAVPALGQVRPADLNPPTFTLRTSIKAGVFVSRTPDPGGLTSHGASTDSLFRVRFEPQVSAGSKAVFAGAYEQRLRYTPVRAGISTVGILPPTTAAPYRIRQLDWSLSESAGRTWRHEIDRASARVHVGSADITVGRQAVGWGRGVMFGAVDLFAPFSPLEADRDWRRGIDAVRADVKLADRSSVDLVGAFGTSWDRSLVAGRLRGYAGKVDLEVMGGRRARDLFGGFTTSAAVGGAEVHGELAAFRTPSAASTADGRVVWKAVAGGSYRFPLGSGLLTYAEYHYSGFGARSPADIFNLLSTPDFMERYVRGDTQILSHHATAVLASYEASPEVTLSGHWLHNPRDRSGVIVPGIALTFSDRLSMTGAGYLPYGASPLGARLRSEYGAAHVSAFAQLRIYL